MALSSRCDPALIGCGLTVRQITPQIDFEKILIWRNDIPASAPLRAFLALWNTTVNIDETKSDQACR